MSTNVYDDLFSDDFGTVWVRKRGRKAREAKRIAIEAEGEPMGTLDVSLVRGTVGEKHGEPWLTIADDGAEEFWQVEYV